MFDAAYRHIELAFVNTLSYFWLSSFILLAIFYISWIYSHRNRVDVPRVYLSDASMFHRWTDRFRVVYQVDKALQKGYTQYPTGFFQLKILGTSYLIVDRSSVSELIGAPKDVLSSRTVNLGVIQARYTFNESIAANSYHSKIVREQLTRRIPDLIPAICDEFVAAFDDELTVGEDWTPVRLFEKSVDILARVNNRVLVGLPLCRNKEYLRQAVEHTGAVTQAALVLGFTPTFLKQTVVQLFPSLRKSREIAYRHLAPLINERRKKFEKANDHNQKPMDMLQWLMDSAEGIEARPDYMAMRVQLLNFSSTMTTVASLIHALYTLAIHPEYIKPLREEILESLGGDWTMTAITKMRKLDSFLKESMRMQSLALLGTGRIALKKYTFSNGVTVPVGTIIYAPLVSIHHDKGIYDGADRFDGFRFNKLREQDAESSRHNASSTSTEFLPWGHGRYACPGRYYAATVIKVFMAFMLLRYEIKTKDGVRPPNFRFHHVNLPSTTAEILLKRIGS